MPDEFDPVAELGLFPDKVFSSSLEGIFVRNNSLRDLCERFVPNGRKLYDNLRMYDFISYYILGRDGSTDGDFLKRTLPFLKGFGATDHAMLELCRGKLAMMPNGAESMRYISKLMPMQITTSMSDHGVLPVEETIDAPLCAINRSKALLDQSSFGRVEARTVRDVAKRITALKRSGKRYSIAAVESDDVELDYRDERFVGSMDEILQDTMDTAIMNLLESSDCKTCQKKGYGVLETRRRTGIDVDGTMYLGSDSTDYEAMDLIKDANGLSVAFNGDEVTVHYSRIAVLSNDANIASLLAYEFYNYGYQAAVDLAGNWSREYLKGCDFGDRNLLDRILEDHKRKLPEVFLVDRSNVDEIGEKSQKYRREHIDIL